MVQRPERSDTGMEYENIVNEFEPGLVELFNKFIEDRDNSLEKISSLQDELEESHR